MTCEKAKHSVDANRMKREGGKGETSRERAQQNGEVHRVVNRGDEQQIKHTKKEGEGNDRKTARTRQQQSKGREENVGKR